MPGAEEHYASLRGRLAALRRRTTAVELGTCTAWALAAGAVLAALWVGLEALLYLRPAARAGLGAAALLGTLVVFAAQAGRRLRGMASWRGFALCLEARCPQLGQRLISALELWGHPASRLYSSDLLAATVASADRDLQEVDWRTVPDLPAARRSLGWLAGVLAAVSMLGVSSAPMAAAAARCLHPLTPFAREPRTRVTMQPGDLEVVKGEDAVVTAHFGGDLPRTARLRRQDAADAPWQEEEVAVDRADSLVYTFHAVQRSLAYQVRARDGSSPVHRISVIDPPTVRRMRLRLAYPAYSGLPPRVDEESGEVQALPGTRVDFEITASKPVATAALVLDDSVRVPAQVEADRARATLRVERSGRYHVALVDERGVANPDPIHHAIEAIHDLPPQVTLTQPGRDVDLPESMQVLLGVDAQDDFGISRLHLAWRVNDGPETRQALAFAPGRQVGLSHVWDLSAADLLPEDRVTYRVEALDNDTVSGPKGGASREYVLRFPSLHELYEETARDQDSTLEDLQSLARDGQQTTDYLEQVQRELLRQRELTWEERKQLESTLGSESERARAVEELAQELQQTAERMQANGLNSDEILQRLAEVRQLMQQVMTPELREALAKLQEALESDDPRRLTDALREFNEDQKAFQQRLERTISLLEQVRAEQQLEAAARQAADLEQRQGQVNDGLGRDEDRDRLQAQENGLQRDTERLHQDVDALGQAMERFDAQTAQDLAAQAQAMQQQNLSGRMQQMAQQMAGDPGGAQRQGQSLEGDLARLAAGMRQMQQHFVAGQKQMLSAEMQRAMRDLLDLSERQEDLRQVTDGHGGPPDTAAEDQFALVQGLSGVVERLAEVGRKTLALERPLSATLGQALQSMGQAAQQLSQREAQGSRESQTQAMGQLNEAALEMRQSLDNLQKSSMPSSFAEAMQKMMGLSEQQSQLNQATQDVFAMGQTPGQMDQQTMAQMRRLADTQRRIRQALEELQRSTRGDRGAQERIGSIQKEMDQVAGDLDAQRLNQSTLSHQQHILQRMLDSSLSIHTHGLDEEHRQSQTGEDRPYAGPGQLPQDLGQSYDQLREALRLALEGPYPEEYRALLRSYYEQLYQDAHPLPRPAAP